MTEHSRVPTRSSGPGISVIIATDGCGKRLDACLRSLSIQDPPVDQLILVGRGPSVAASSSRVQIVEADGGRAAQHNAGAAVAGGDILAFVAGDGKIQPGWTAAMLEAFGAGAALAAGAIFEPRGAHRPSRQHDLKGRRDFLPSVSVLNLAIDSNVFETLGGFDHAVCGVEDRDLSFRAQLAGHRITPAPEAALYLRGRGGVSRELRAVCARPALRHKYRYFKFHDALHAWHRPLLTGAEAIGWVRLLSGRRPVPGFVKPANGPQELTVRELPEGPSLALVGAPRSPASALDGLGLELAIPPPGLLEQALPRWDEPAPWTMRLARLAAQLGWGMPVELIARRLELERPARWGEACLALHGIFAWGSVKDGFGFAVTPPSKEALMARFPELPLVGANRAKVTA